MSDLDFRWLRLGDEVVLSNIDGYKITAKVIEAGVTPVVMWFIEEADTGECVQWAGCISSEGFRPFVAGKLTGLDESATLIYAKASTDLPSIGSTELLSDFMVHRRGKMIFCGGPYWFSLFERWIRAWRLATAWRYR